MTYKTELDWHFGDNAEMKKRFTALIGKFVETSSFSKEDIEDIEDPDDMLANDDWGFSLSNFAERNEEDYEDYATAISFPHFHNATYLGTLSQLIFLYIRDVM